MLHKRSSIGKRSGDGQPWAPLEAATKPPSARAAASPPAHLSRPGQVSEDELVSTLKHLVSEKLNIPVRQQRLLFKGKALADGKRLSDYSIGPNSKLNLVVKPLEKVLLEESTARKTAEAPVGRTDSGLRAKGFEEQVEVHGSTQELGMHCRRAH
ncbi:PREDICTED: ubiquitin-like protein 4A, partial [Bison bison bison]|uniref:Ubiquitin-like protein 4A n=1 Tax=Bison bison bison TaxID=43346 RepID=A0A6P3HTX0_BISBB